MRPTPRWSVVPILRLLVLFVVLAAVVAACGGGPSKVEVQDTAAPADFAYVIPAGTGGRIDRGERVDVIPADLHVRVGQVIRIENADDRGHLVGPFFVGAGETVTQRFSAPGVLQGSCSVHPSGTMTVTVEP